MTPQHESTQTKMCRRSSNRISPFVSDCLRRLSVAILKRQFEEITRPWQEEPFSTMEIMGPP
jgi:hypothetical protein